MDSDLTVTRRRAATLGAALCLAAAAACDSPVMNAPPPGYDPTVNTTFIYNWRPGSEIRIFVDRNQEPDNADLDAAVRAAIKVWEPVGRLGEIRMRVVSQYRDADVVFHHSRAPRIVEGDCLPPVLGSGGLTAFCTDDAQTRYVPLPFADGTPGAAKMVVSINVFALDTAEFFGALVAHEMGHVLGIGAHSPDPADLMYGRPRKFAPTAADATTLRYVLSRRPQVRF